MVAAGQALPYGPWMDSYLRLPVSRRWRMSLGMR